MFIREERKHRTISYDIQAPKTLFVEIEEAPCGSYEQTLDQWHKHKLQKDNF
jgi:hypothetical protein